MNRFFFILMLSVYVCESVSGFFLFHRQRANKIQQAHKTTACKTPNVRTALFRSSSVSKTCWNAEELATLLARAIMQNVLPRRMPRNMPLLFEYFKDCMETVKQEVQNDYVRIMMATAMIDVLGGYLQAFGIPVMKRLYYEGNLEFDVVNDFVKLQNNFKTILGTDGGGWTRPISLRRNRKISNITQLKIVFDKENACRNLIAYSDKNINKGKEKSEGLADWMYIPMPKLDDPKHPGAIAVPFRDSSLFSLQSKTSYDVLITYYTTSMNCLYSMSNDTNNNFINFFECYFYKWLKKNVIPRLNDDTWYTGFFGTFRILATIKSRGLPLSNLPKLNFIKSIENKYLLFNEDTGNVIPPVSDVDDMATILHSTEKPENISRKSFRTYFQAKRVITKACRKIAEECVVGFSDDIDNDNIYLLTWYKNLPVWTKLTMLSSITIVKVVCVLICCRRYCRKTDEPEWPLLVTKCSCSVCPHHRKETELSSYYCTRVTSVTSRFSEITYTTVSNRIR